MRGGAVKVVQVRGGNFTKHITSERAAHYCDQGQPLQPGPSSGAVSIKRRFVSSHRISSSTHGRSYRPGETRAALMASTSTWDQGFALHTSVTSAYITDIIERHFFTLQFHFVPTTRLIKKVKHKLRAKLPWTSLASEPREQGHNYPKPVISDLGHGGCEYTEHSTCSSVGGETMSSLGPRLRCLLVYLHLRIRAFGAVFTIKEKAPSRGVAALLTTLLVPYDI